MMSDFTSRFAGRSASTDDFRAVAGEHFVKTRVAQKFGIRDLDWFFQQWVFSTALPSYRLEYSIEPDGDAFLIKGTVFQEGVPAGENWFMPLPLVIRLDGDKVGRALVYAMGPQTPVNLRIASKPKAIELDPDMWVLSEKTTAIVRQVRSTMRAGRAVTVPRRGCRGRWRRRWRFVSRPPPPTDPRRTRSPGQRRRLQPAHAW